MERKDIESELKRYRDSLERSTKLLLAIYHYLDGRWFLTNEYRGPELIDLVGYLEIEKRFHEENIKYLEEKLLFCMR